MSANQQLGDAGFVAGNDLVIHEVHLSNGGKTDANNAELVSAQRQHLNALVRDLASATGEEGYAIWRQVHRLLGVDHIDKIRRHQYPLAVEFLEGRMAAQNEMATCGSLISHILKLADQPDTRDALYGHCRRTFGTTFLKALNREQLLSALKFLENLPAQEPTALEPEPKIGFFDVVLQWARKWF